MPEKFDPQIIATTLMGCAQDTLQKTCQITLSQKPTFIKREIIEYDSKMRLLGLEKFNGPCYLSSINFYLDQQHFSDKICCGVVALFVEEAFAEIVAKSFGQKGLDCEDPEIIMDCSGEICNVIVGQFKNELRSFGYSNLVISAPIKAINDIPEGVDFPYGEDSYYELSFVVKGEKVMVAIIVLAPIPNINTR